jgi:hypothetical protein
MRVPAFLTRWTVLAVVLAVATAPLAHARATPPLRLRAAASLRAATVSSKAITLRWRDRARGETRWEVRRGSARAKKVHVRGAQATSYTDRSVAAGKTYTYYVRPCRRHACGASKRLRVRVPMSSSGKGPTSAPPPTAPTAPGSPGTHVTDGTPSATDSFAGSPTIGGCPVFPNNNAWNTDVSQYPVDRAKSDAYINALGATTLWPDFGSGRYGDYGIPFTTVGLDQPLVPIAFTEDDVADESDPGPYPIPPDVRVEAAADPDADHHVLVLRRGDCQLFELYDATKAGAGWTAYSAARFDLRSNALRPDTFTSADAAGLPILPGLARADEAAGGAIRHALRITVPHTQDGFIHPATHAASASSDPALPPMGLRIRLKPGYNVNALHGQARVIARALQVYGALVADNAGGSRVYISGTPDPAWDDDDLDQLKAIPTSQLVAVVTGPVQHGE